MSSEEIQTEEEGIVENPTAVEEIEEEPEAKKTNEFKRAKVVYDYEARESDELSLDKGDVLTVLEEGEDGWWRGDLNGKVGSFPANHVKLIEAQNQSTEDGEDTENSEGKKKKTLNKYGVKAGGLGSLFSGGVPVLKKRSQPTPESLPVSEEKHAMASVPVLRKTSMPSPVSQQSSSPLPHLPPKKKPPKPKKVELPKAEVVHEYKAEGDDEISLIQGTHVTILEKIDDDGWWNGRNEQGQTGLFPSTYVKEIKQQSVPEEVIESNIEEAEIPVTTQAEFVTSEPAPISADSPIRLSPQDTYDSEDSPTLPKSPPPPMRRTTNETSSPPTPRRSTSESSQSATPQRRSTYESTSPISPTSSRRDSSHDGEEHVTSRRPPSVVSPDLSIQSNSPNSPDHNSVANIDATPVSPEERPTVPPRQTSRPSSLYEDKTDSQKSPTLAKPPTVPKNFSPAKPPVVPPVKRSSSKSDKSKSETLPTETVSPKIQHDSFTELENQDDNNIENEEQADETVKEREETIVEKVDEEMEVLKEVENLEEAKSDKEVITENIENVEEDGDTTGSQEVESEEKKPQPQLPPLPTGPKLSNLGKDRPVIRNRKIPSAKSVKETASQSQTATLLEAVASVKDEDEPKPQPVASPPTPPKPEKPAKPSTFKLPTLGAGVQLRHVAKKPPVETSTESTETTTSNKSGVDTKPITGGVKGISSRFNQFSGIPNSSDVEFKLKKWFNEEINKVKSQFEAQLAEERGKREALEEEFRELIASLQE